jgi:hypothetical protein
VVEELFAVLLLVVPPHAESARAATITADATAVPRGEMGMRGPLGVEDGAG